MTPPDGMILDLTVTNTSDPIGDVKTGASLGCSDHAVQESASPETHESSEE